MIQAISRQEAPKHILEDTSEMSEKELEEYVQQQLEKDDVQSTFH